MAVGLGADSSSGQPIIGYGQQVENNASFSGPWIFTSGASATVNGPQQVATVIPPAQISGILKFSLLALNLPTDSRRVLQIDDTGGGIANAIVLWMNSGNLNFGVWTGSANQATLTLGAAATGVQAIAFSVGTNYAMAQRVGDAPPAADTSVTYPSTMSRVSFGGEGASAIQNSYLDTQKAAFDTNSPANASMFAGMLALAQAA